MSEKEKQALSEFAAAVESPEIRAFAEGYKAGRAAQLLAHQPEKEEAEQPCRLEYGGRHGYDTVQ